MRLITATTTAEAVAAADAFGPLGYAAAVALLTAALAVIGGAVNGKEVR